MSSHPRYAYLTHHASSSLSEGAVVHVVEEDDGSGWVKVMDETGAKGLVPASYVQLDAAAPERVEAASPHTASRPQGSGVRGKNLSSTLHRRSADVFRAII